MYAGDLFEAVQQSTRRLTGAYAIAVFCRDEPHRVVGARHGSPLVVGCGTNENFLASDALALAGTTDQIRSEEHTSELQSLMRISYDVFCLKTKNNKKQARTI